MTETEPVIEGAGDLSSFLRPASANQDADLHVDVIRRGRRTSTVRAAMVQDGRPRLEAIATFGDLAAAEVNGRRLDIPPPDLPSPQDCLDRSRLLQDVELALLSRVEVPVDPAKALRTGPDGGADADSRSGGSAGSPTDAPTLTGWIRFADGRPPDVMAPVLFADCFPPSVFNAFGRTGSIPTIELTVHVRRRPVAGSRQLALIAS